MIFLLSDVHGDASFPGLHEYLKKGTDSDLLIILGDICLDFEKTEENRRFTEWFLSAKKNIAIVDGNHENFEYLNSFPEEEWNGGTVRRLTEKIVLLRRGNIYNIGGKRFFVFGGCKSSPRWKAMGLWYPGDEPSEEEIANAYESLKRNDCSVDYILTHKYEQIPERGTVCPPLRELTKFIEDNVKYVKWYSGHWHVTEETDDTHMTVYDRLIEVEEKFD